jgi:sortase A
VFRKISNQAIRMRADGRGMSRMLAECASWTGGLACLVFWGVCQLTGAVGTQSDLVQFTAMRSAGHLNADDPDASDWSEKRIAAWKETLRRKSPVPLGILRISRIGLEVPILEGTDDWTLNRAVGHVGETALPGMEGNSGIAGHRDGFFRGLKDLAPGDVIEIETLRATDSYSVERTWIVDPHDVSVLDRTSLRSITLITCYPFYFIGPAPQRYIVRAVVAGSPD